MISYHLKSIETRKLYCEFKTFCPQLPLCNIIQNITWPSDPRLFQSTCRSSGTCMPLFISTVVWISRLCANPCWYTFIRVVPNSHSILIIILGIKHIFITRWPYDISFRCSVLVFGRLGLFSRICKDEFEFFSLWYMYSRNNFNFVSRKKILNSLFAQYIIRKYILPKLVPLHNTIS